MAIPKLKMIESDINIAISRQFKKDCKSLLKDSDGNSYIIDNEGGCTFFMAPHFAGTGEYHANGSAKLIIKNNDCLVSKWYNIAFSIFVSEVDSSPSIHITPPITIKSK